MKHTHEIRDAIHVFIRLDTDERSVVDSSAVQRLRHVQQLALTNLVYPGATHKRFEHSLGVMELAGRVFDVLTRKELSEKIKKSFPVDFRDEGTCKYWRRVVRLAALCHDTGHLPFSHAAEKELLPEGWDHERITRALIEGKEMGEIFARMRPPVAPVDVVKVAVGPKNARDLKFDNWETILSEIIVNAAFGVDRMDYLLRDSHHAGVAYGRFDHYRLVDTLRILPVIAGDEESTEPTVGIEEGGIQSAEALLYARYLMFSQLYFHPVRRIYDIHLKEFLSEWLTEGLFSTDIYKHLAMTDNEVMTAMVAASRDEDAPGHDAAQTIISRRHFRLLYGRNPQDIARNPAAVTAVFRAARKQFSAENIRCDDPPRKAASAPEFPVLMRDGRVASSLQVSEVLNHLPGTAVGFVFVHPDKANEAHMWLEKYRDIIVRGVSQ